ncbi:MAG: hypothetical protein R6U66_11805 [Bacteroidales bacterium]|jgi:hypothetical protein
MFLLRILLFFVILYLILKFVFRFLVYGFVKKHTQNFQTSQEKQKKEGTTHINYPGNEDQKLIDTEDGEYVDYEEVKDDSTKK